MPAPGTPHSSLQRLVKDCEAKAEAAKRPSAQQLPSAAPQAANGQQRRASGATASSEQDSDDSVDTTEPAATQPAAAKASAAPAALAVNGGSPVGDSGEDDSEVTGWWRCQREWQLCAQS